MINYKLSNEKNLAPLAIFCYNRIDKLKKLIDSLELNEETSKTKVYFFVDLYEKNKAITEEIKDYLKGISFFLEKNIILREKNYGLKKNIEDGIDHIFKFEEKIICLEDDLVLDKYFLSYMNLCLDKYNSKNEIWHINGWSHPQQRLFLSEIFVGKIVNVWGWATWKNRWIKHSIRSEDNISKLDKNSIKRFNFYNLNRNFQQQLIDNDINKINTWAIYWYQTVFLNHGKTIYPKHSLVRNTGLDGSGTNSGKTKYFDPSLKNVNLSKFSKSLEVDKVNNTFTILFYLKIYISKKYTYYKNKLNKKFNP